MIKIGIHRLLYRRPNKTRDIFVEECILQCKDIFFAARGWLGDVLRSPDVPSALPYTLPYVRLCTRGLIADAGV